MKKKSLIFLILLIVLVSILAISCSKQKGSTYVDGEYFAIEKEFPASGWKDYVSLTVKDGKITRADWGGLNREGDDKKLYDKAGKYNMVKFGNAVAEWWQQAEKAEAYLIKTQDPTKIKLNKDGETDEISGVTITVEGFFRLADEALKAGPVTPGSYKDGSYYAIEDDFGSSGWKSYASFLVKNGNIVDAYWSALNEEGEDKQTVDKAGGYNMVKFGGAIDEWYVQAGKVQQHLLKTQDPKDVTYNEDGSTDDIAGATVSVDDFFGLVEKALAAGPKK
ncbi:MAG: FMN-binding protein [Sphaerochaetaceae bacterium]